MNFSAEELRRLWLDLYRDEVARLASARASLHPGDMHDLASEHADTHLRHFNTPPPPEEVKPASHPPDLMDLTEYDPSALRAHLDCNGPTGMASLIVARTMPPSPAAAIGTGQADTGNITISCLGDSGSLVPIGQRGAT